MSEFFFFFLDGPKVKNVRFQMNFITSLPHVFARRAIVFAIPSVVPTKTCVNVCPSVRPSVSV